MVINSTNIIAVLFLCVFASVDGIVAKAQPLPKLSSDVIKVLNYNVHGLPVAKNFENKTKKGDKGRFRYIGKELYRKQITEGLDVVLLQEAFIKESALIIEHARFPYVVKGPKDKMRLLNSGLYVLSRHPILDVKKVTYKSTGSKTCASEDCFASKAMMAVLIQPVADKPPVWILNTHMQAGSENDEVRIRQITGVAQKIRQISENNLVVYAGDFNFKPNRHPSYDYFQSQFSFFADIGVTCLLMADPNCVLDVGKKNDGSIDGRYSDVNDLFKSNHDRQFYSTNAVNNYTLKPIYVGRGFDTKVEGGFLSDHWSFEAHYSIHR